MRRSQKLEIAKGLIGFDECKIALYDSYRERDDLKYAFAVEHETVQLYDELYKGLMIENGTLINENKKLKASRFRWKVFAITTTIIGFYIGTQL